MTNDDSTNGSGGGSRDRDRLPPYAPAPSGWVLPENTGAVQLPDTDSGAHQESSAEVGAAQEVTTPEVTAPEAVDPTQSASGDPVIPDPLVPDSADSAPADAALANSTPADSTPVDLTPMESAPPVDLDTDAMLPSDVEELPSVDEVSPAEFDDEVSSSGGGLAWGAVPASTDAASAAAPEERQADLTEPATTVIPVSPATDPGEVSRTQAIAGLTAASASGSSASGSHAVGSDAVASEADAEASAAAMAGTDSPKVVGRVQQNHKKDPIRTIARGIGQTLITLGVVVLLFVVYEVYVTDLFGNQKQDKVQAALDEKWSQKEQVIPSGSSSSAPSETPTSVDAPPPAPAALVVDPAERARNYDTTIGQGFAKIFIPALGSDYEYTIVEGTTIEDLYGSPGHYDDTQYPGELGNFAVAGHRVSKGSPFNALGTLSSCDSIVIETQDDWFIYRILPMEDEIAGWNPAARPDCANVAPLTGEYAGLQGREITLPSDYAQVLPVPGVDATGPQALAAATQRIITLTTCHPQFSDAERMIVHGVLVTSYAKADGFVPPELSEG